MSGWADAACARVFFYAGLASFGVLLPPAAAMAGQESAKPLTIILDAKSDTGASHKDGVTSEVRPVVGGRGFAGARIEISDGNRIVARVVADKRGRWSATLPRLDVGPHRLDARDEAGNVASSTILIDNIPPVAPYDLEVVEGRRDQASHPYAVMGPSGGRMEGRTSGRTASLNPVLRADGVVVYDGRKALARAGTSYGAFNLTLPKLTSGVHKLLVVAVDLAGNQSPPSRTFILVIAKQPTVALGRLNAQSGFRLDGAGRDGYMGDAVSGLGDVNGDGLEDVAISGQKLSIPGLPWTGGTYVIFGKAGAWPDATKLVVDGSNGFALPHYTVMPVGDVNGDGIDDFFVLQDAGGTATRRCVVFGRSSGFPKLVSLETLPSADRFCLLGSTFNAIRAGDVDGDGVGDFMVQGSVGDAGRKGKIDALFVIYGRTTGFPDTVDIADLDEISALRISGSSAYNGIQGRFVAAGDVNGDGFGDIFLATRGPSSESSVGFVIFGAPRQERASIALDTLTPTSGLKLVHRPQVSIEKLAGGGDFNGDGFADVAFEMGSTFVLYGRSQWPTGLVDLDDPPKGALTRFTQLQDGQSSGDGLGTPNAIAIDGDWNNDGIDDLAVAFSRHTAAGAPDDSGFTRLILGRKAAWGASVPLESLERPEALQFVGSSFGEESGTATAFADLNADGVDDFLIGAPGARPSGLIGAGRVYVVKGQQ